jgi:uncharacterized protein (TIGR02246 family)
VIVQIGEINMKALFSGTFFPMALALGIVNSAQAGEVSVRAIAETANSTWNQALNSGNAAVLAKLYSENATVSPGNGQTLIGRTEIENLFKSFVLNGVHNHKIDIVDVNGNGNLIYQVAKWSAQGAESNGSKPSFGGILMSVLEKNPDGNWQIRSHVWNAAN